MVLGVDKDRPLGNKAPSLAQPLLSLRISISQKSVTPLQPLRWNEFRVTGTVTPERQAWQPCVGRDSSVTPLADTDGSGSCPCSGRGGPAAGGHAGPSPQDRYLKNAPLLAEVREGRSWADTH
jgi:hypothetical protein